MTITNFRTVLALTFAVAINATAWSTSLAADGSAARPANVRQAAAEEAANPSDDLVIPELDKPASARPRKQITNPSATDRSSAPARSGSAAESRNASSPEVRSGSAARSSASRQSAGSSKAEPRFASRDDLDPSDDPATKHLARPAPRNVYPPTAENALARNPNRYPATQSGAYMVPQSAGGARTASSYPPPYGQTRGASRPTSAMFYDNGNMPAGRQPMRVAQNAPPQTYPEYRPGMRIANRYEPTPAAPGVPPDTTESTSPETVAPGTSTPHSSTSGEVYGPYSDEFGDCGQCGAYGSCGQCGPYGDCGDCGGGCESGCGCTPCFYQHGGWFAGAELLVLRPTSSENVAFQRQVSTNVNVATQVDTVVQKDWGYTGSFRTFVGYRLCDCCEEIRFTYWNYNNSTHQISPQASDDGTTTTQFTGQLEINALNPGETLQANNSLLMNTYDIDYSKCICYGSCDPCSCCAPWGLRYTIGIRIADIQRGDASQVNTPNEGISASSFINTKFTGAGPRVGLEGRRWFGCNNCWSMYARSNLALVLGQFDIDESASNSQSSTGTFVHQSYHDSHDRVVPMTEIELGANWQMNCHWNLSGGYTWQAWWDLGMFEQGANTFQEPIDTSNILSLDGLFLRLEYQF